MMSIYILVQYETKKVFSESMCVFGGWGGVNVSDHDYLSMIQCNQ